MFRIKYCREIVLKLLYQIDVLGIGEEASRNILESNSNFFRGLNLEESEYIQKIIIQVLENIRTIDEEISNLLIDWSLKRLTPVDRNLLRMGIAESNFTSEKAIIIDDIIRIAKKYGGEDSYKIINAILDKVIV